MTWKDGEYHPKQKRGDEKKDRILDAALDLFETKGFHGTTAKAIAAKAGVATGSFYRYFRDKKAVFMAVSMRMEAHLGGGIFDFGRRMRQEDRSEQEILASLISFSTMAHQRHKGFPPGSARHADLGPRRGSLGQGAGSPLNCFAYGISTSNGMPIPRR